MYLIYLLRIQWVSRGKGEDLTKGTLGKGEFAVLSWTLRFDF